MEFVSLSKEGDWNFCLRKVNSAFSVLGSFFVFFAEIPEEP